MEESYVPQYPLIFVNTLLCSSNNKVTQVCLQQDCQSVCFICNEETCHTCLGSHHNCSAKNTIQSFAKAIQQQRLPMQMEKQICKAKIEEIYDGMLDIVSRSKISFLESIDNYSLKQSSIRVVNYFNSGNHQNITGNLARKVVMHQEQRNIFCYFQQNINQMQTIIGQHLDNLLLQYKNLCFDEGSKKMMELVSIDQRNICKNTQLGWQSQSTFYDYIKEGKKPAAISYFRIEYKDFENNTIPKCLTILENLSGLNISLSKLDAISNLETFSNLQVLDLYWNNIKKIQNLQSLVNLRELNLSQNVIEKIENLQHQKQLTFLSLRNNQLKTIQNLGHLTNLKKLLIYDNLFQRQTERQHQLLKKLTRQGTLVYLKSAKIAYPRLS